MNSPRGPRDDLEIAVQLDSDGQLGEEELNPLEVEGPALLVDSESEVKSLSAQQARSRVVFFDCALVHRTLWPRREVESRASQLFRGRPTSTTEMLSTPCEFLQGQARRLGVTCRGRDVLGLVSDNGAFSGFDVPNADLGYGVVEETQMGGVQIPGGIRAAYDTAELAREESDALLGMAQIALGTVMASGEDKPQLRTTPSDQARAVFVGTQTEPPYIGPSGLTDFAMAFEHADLDVDLIPYGSTLSAEDLQEVRVVFALPPVDYPCQEAGNVAEYDVAWIDREIELLREYVEDGGLLVLVNSGHRLKYGYPPLDQNEDWSQMNALGEVFGITFQEGSTWGELASPGTHALVRDREIIRLADSNGVPFTYDSGETLAQAHGDAVMGLVRHRDGRAKCSSSPT